jgi:transaldolase
MPSLSTLEALRRHSTVVADTADFELLARYQAQEATTNPSLVLRSSQDSRHQAWLRQVLKLSANQKLPLPDQVLMAFANEILQRIPGRVSIEVDARLAFDRLATLQKAHDLRALAVHQGIDAKRLLIKVAATWEGIEAARELGAQGIACNLTLVFSLAQAMACGDAGVTLISPFVGRVGDWYQKNGLSWGEDPQQDPGVQLVRRIFESYKARGVKTQIMGASFRRKDQILALAGCDLLSIAPSLLEELAQSAQSTESLTPRLMTPRHIDLPWIHYTESQFRLTLNEDAMATEKLSEGLRLFTRDARLLDELLDQIRA